MKPGLLDICAIILSLAMALILAFEVAAPRERWRVQLRRTGRERQERRALGAASPQPQSPTPQSITDRVTVTRRSFPSREVGEEDFAPVRERLVGWPFHGRRSEKADDATAQRRSVKPPSGQSILNFL
jgi:hypothetical protein